MGIILMRSGEEVKPLGRMFISFLNGEGAVPIIDKLARYTRLRIDNLIT